MRFSPGSLRSEAKADRTARQFATLIGRAVNATVSPVPIKFVRVPAEDFKGFIAHVEGKEPAAIQISNGQYIFLVHRLGLRREQRFLTTLEYGYWYQADESEDSWIFRYEYLREPEPPYHYPRSHVHVNAKPETYSGTKPFPELHLPAGDRVTIESFLRHIIEEHDVPPISPHWEEILRETEAAFREIQQKRALDPADSN